LGLGAYSTPPSSIADIWEGRKMEEVGQGEMESKRKGRESPVAIFKTN